jgi:hypothetical protein
MFRYKLQIIRQTFFKTTKQFHFHNVYLSLSNESYKKHEWSFLSSNIVSATQVSTAMKQTYWLQDYVFDDKCKLHKLHFCVVFQDDVDTLVKQIVQVLPEVQLEVKETNEVE